MQLEGAMHDHWCAKEWVSPGHDDYYNSGKEGNLCQDGYHLTGTIYPTTPITQDATHGSLESKLENPISHHRGLEGSDQIVSRNGIDLNGTTSEAQRP